MLRLKIKKGVCWILLLVLVISTLLTACGKKEQSTGGEKQQSQQSEQTTEKQEQANNDNQGSDSNQGETGDTGKTEDRGFAAEDEGYSEPRQIRDEEGNLLLTLEPNELFIFISNDKIIEKGEMETTPEQEAQGITGKTLLREKLIGQYIKEVFPNLKYRIVAWDENGIREKYFESSGVYPDLILDLIDRNTTRVIKQYDMQYDLTPLIEKYNFDLSQIDEACMAIVKDRGAGAIYSIPFQINDYILFYNKHWFDKKGLPYPTEGMTYDQIYELAKQLTFQDGVRVIKGYLQHPDQYLKLNQKGLIPFSLTERDKVVINTPEWLEVVNNIKRFYEIPQNIWTTTDDFWTQGTVAMAVDHIEKLMQAALVKDYIGEEEYEVWKARLEGTNPSLARPGEDWDIAPIPVWEEGSNTIYRPNVLGWFIPKQSKMKHTAFQIIMHLVSYDVQLRRAKDGIKGVIYSEEIANSYGANVPELQKLNLKAVYWGKNAVQPIRKPEVAGEGYWDIPLWMVFRQYILKDGLTAEAALKRGEEEFNKWIEDQKAQGKKW